MSQAAVAEMPSRPWSPVLDRMDAELAEALGRTIMPAEAVRPGLRTDETARLDAHLGTMETAVSRSGRLADEADAALAEAAAALEQWRDRAAALQRRLAEWATRAV